MSHNFVWCEPKRTTARVVCELNEDGVCLMACSTICTRRQTVSAQDRRWTDTYDFRVGYSGLIWEIIDSTALSQCL